MNREILIHKLVFLDSLMLMSVFSVIFPLGVLTMIYFRVGIFSDWEFFYIYFNSSKFMCDINVKGKNDFSWEFIYLSVCMSKLLSKVKYICTSFGI